MLDELIQNHPFYKLSLCESPIELKFLFSSQIKYQVLSRNKLLVLIELILLFLKRKLFLRLMVMNSMHQEKTEPVMQSAKDIYMV